MANPKAIRFLSLPVLVLLAGPAAAAVDPAVRCEVSRLKLAARYASCLLITDAKALLAGAAADHTACDGKFQTKWAAVQARYGSDCPPTNEVTLVEDILSTCTADALVPPASYFVVFGVTNSVSIGTLQFTVDYTSSDGEFAGSGTLVSCTSMQGSVLFSATDTDLSKSLQAGIVGPTPLATPADLARCVFDRATYGLAEAEDFTITVNVATDGDGNPIDPQVEIVSIDPVP